MSDLIQRAEVYATQAHERINHRRKYSNLPYQEHLRAVAALVAECTDDREMIAAAWLHDTLEDTPATSGQLEQEFGPTVAKLVEELTDVSKPSDGNRATRKEIDRVHLSLASARAQTVKLADLIDNCRDITRHDPRFAEVYLAEMAALLEVLQQGHKQLRERAYEVHAECTAQLQRDAVDRNFTEPPTWRRQRLSGISEKQFERLFTDLFSARDIAEPLLSFDNEKIATEIQAVLAERHKDVASIRVDGMVTGYVRQSDLDRSPDARLAIRTFTVDQVVSGGSSLFDVTHVLNRHDHCFVTSLGEVAGVICRDDINKPIVRMWLFGIITLIEITLVDMVVKHFPNDSWQDRISESRLKKAKAFQHERQRRNQHCGLIDCLQFSDKGYILIGFQPTLEALGFASRRTARRVLADLESLRNNLAHAQDIVAHDWVQIARISRNIQEFSGS